jgi:hypothetical protein
MEVQPVQHGRGLSGLDRHAWVTLAEERVYELVDNSLAVQHVEIEARLWEAGWKPPGENRYVRFFPHILSEAVNNLTSNGNIKLISHQTKGGGIAQLYVPSDISRRTAAVTAATRRKAMLYARFTRLSSTFGPAGESVVRGSLQDAAGGGYFPITDGFGEVRRLANVALPGALDSAAWTLISDVDSGIPRTAALLIEVKNRRLTLYPRHPEVHQLLTKAALLQAEHPTLDVIPLLICRRAHDRLFWMAKDLGFLVHATQAQYLTLPKKTPMSHVDEVRRELALNDLRVVTRETPPRIINLFASTVPKEGMKTARRWSSVGSRLLSHYQALRPVTIDAPARNAALAALRSDAEAVLARASVPDPILAWALGDEVEPSDWLPEGAE